jgi:hypothetical protein
MVKPEKVLGVFGMLCVAIPFLLAALPHGSSVFLVYRVNDGPCYADFLAPMHPLGLLEDKEVVRYRGTRPWYRAGWCYRNELLYVSAKQRELAQQLHKATQGQE